MRFITSMMDDEGYHNSVIFKESMWLLCELSDGSAVTGEDLKEIDAMGYCSIPDTELTAVVAYDKKAQRLYDFINSVYTVSSRDALDCSNADMIYNGSCVSAFPNPNLVINTEHSKFHARGKLGSVILVTSGYSRGRYQIYNLYECLVNLCKEYKVNILKYERIQLHDKSSPYLTVIELSQTKEAKVFFTKMWMDVARR